MSQELSQFETVIAFPTGEAFRPVENTQRDPPTGFYSVLISDVGKFVKDDGKESYHFRVSILDPGPAAGMTPSVWVQGDWSKEFNRRHLKTLLVGMGGDLTKLPASFTIKPETFRGKKCFISVVAPPEGEEVDEVTGKRVYADILFATREQYERAKTAATAAGTGGTVTPITREAPAAGSKPPSAPAGAPPTGDLTGMFP